MSLRWPATDAAPRVARRLRVGGRVQGVGYRPFVYRVAHALALGGWVRNGGGHVDIHVEGASAALTRFERALVADAPPLAKPTLESTAATRVQGLERFDILASEDGGAADAHVPPDLFCCDECLEEMKSPGDRRYRYPFVNCTQCGPRYTLIAALPYDRPNTSMASFALCGRCRAEYENPGDRRFHAQPLACPDCGPQLSYWREGATDFRGEAALTVALQLLREGGVVAVKGVGGYHLLCDAANDAAVRRLRERKRRPAKPLAVMFPEKGEDGLAEVRRHARLDAVEAGACRDPARPIVLAERRPESGLSESLAPGLNELGVFLPYSPLHHLLLDEFDAPLVATSGNVSGEPVITDSGEARRRLAAVADAFLDHDRPIVRPADDSVVRVVAGAARPVRIGRGLGPAEVELPFVLTEPTLAVGGHMKNAIALGWGRRAVVSPHIGDLDSPRSLDVFATVAADLQRLYGVTARRIACDLHPGYASARWAMAQGLRVIRVQHHGAHASALAAERSEVARWLVFAWDGVGLGPDGALWGGEALLGRPGAWRRAASFRPFRLVGGDRAAREPWRSAAALMWEAGRIWTPAHDAQGLGREAWRKGIGASHSSAAGRLFDGAAAIVLSLDVASFEGEGPMRLESAAAEGGSAIPLPLLPDEKGVLRADWAPLLPMLADASLGEGIRAANFLESLAQSLADQAVAIATTETFDAVGLTGGVFQNRRLAERACGLLAECGFKVHMPAQLPANDGGLAFGQLAESAALDAASRELCDA